MSRGVASSGSLATCTPNVEIKSASLVRIERLPKRVKMGRCLGRLIFVAQVAFWSDAKIVRHFLLHVFIELSSDVSTGGRKVSFAGA